MSKKITSALISVFYKDGLEPLVRELQNQGVTIYSTGGTQNFIQNLGIAVVPVEDLTTYPSILGGRVKTLHPSVFGVILGRRDNEADLKEMQEYKIPVMDLVIVDLYPFQETVAQTTDEKLIIEKIDIGGPSMIRAAAKNRYCFKRRLSKIGCTIARAKRRGHIGTTPQFCSKSLSCCDGLRYCHQQLFSQRITINRCRCRPANSVTLWRESTSASYLLWQLK
jgi:hypothetical protein